jgi:predicted Co/Zn/Cd cation transporter (cation efflux family)
MANEYGKEAIIEIFMNRDNMKHEQAVKKFDRVKAQINKAANKGDYEKAENALYKVGLELDYLEAFLL